MVRMYQNSTEAPIVPWHHRGRKDRDRQCGTGRQNHHRLDPEERRVL